MTSAFLSRRTILKGLGSAGCSAAAWPFMSGITMASAPWDARLVVIVLRGAVDGLDVVRPVGDPAFAGLRSGFGNGVHDLDGFFALNAGLSQLMPLWDAGELAFAHAVSTPYRNERSHFDGQNMLEAGMGPGSAPGERRDGWLNRLLQASPGIHMETGFAIGRGDLRILAGDAPVANWSPDSRLSLGSAAEQLLVRMYRSDPLFRDAAAEALVLSRDTEGLQSASARTPGRPERAIAEFAASRMRGATRIASFSLSGWDTHRAQAREMPGLLGRLSDTILTLQRGLGPVWSETAILAVTEFGRTVRQNGSQGTDHGTGGVMLMAGGAVRGGVVYTDWPGLSEENLLDRRDLMPTADVRGYAGAVMQGLFGLEQSMIERHVFPGLDLAGLPEVVR
ncbi:DUF1501 domain-containing protein [uncultured Roseobacter sp.]|uniref:DUF1501 domain-containing protein n=1 Tax=uncultured Roseobacter sp. TaxID=114847 RepID=UPI002610FA69|nr:DUF1501 domain-containing protein [uncultured Roseobacter sp.]